jgi:type IV pilus assembly protein PilB
MMSNVGQGRIGEQLLAAGLITQEQLDVALTKQKQEKGFLGDALVRMGVVKPELVGQMLSAVLCVPYINLATTAVDPEAYCLLTEDFQRQHNVLPYQRSDRYLNVAMRDPLNVMLSDEIELLTGYKAVPALALHDDLQTAFQRINTAQVTTASVLKEIEESDDAPEPEETNDQLMAKAQDAPVIRLVNSIVSTAISMGASDIHLEPEKINVRVRFRLDGILYKEASYPRYLHPAVVSRIKIISGMNIAERRRPQDGRIGFKTDTKAIDLRVSTMLMAGGEKIVMRLLDQEAIRISLEQLGFFPDQLEIWRSFLNQPHGIALVSGPTGSGKSTTLYASLNQINEVSRNIITVEDPIEYRLQGVNQSEVHAKIGVNFASAMRTMLRQDPDVILVGEIRDFETAEIAIQASLTGHLVFSTVHTNDAPGALIRLDNMGVERFLINSAVIGVIGQRLLRKVCPECAIEAPPSPEAVASLGISANQLRGARTVRTVGCDRCTHRGYKGRIAVYEVMPMSRTIQNLLKKGEDGPVIKHAARKEGMVTMREAGIRRALEGSTTLEEVCRLLLKEEEPAIEVPQPQQQLLAA